MFSPSAPHARPTCVTKFFGVLSSFFCFDTFFEPRSFWKFLKPPSSSMRSGMQSSSPPFATSSANFFDSSSSLSSSWPRISSFAASSVISFPSFTGLTSAVILMASSDSCWTSTSMPNCSTSPLHTMLWQTRQYFSCPGMYFSSASSHFLHRSHRFSVVGFFLKQRPIMSFFTSSRRDWHSSSLSVLVHAHLLHLLLVLGTMHFRIFLAPIFLIMSNLSASRRQSL